MKIHSLHTRNPLPVFPSNPHPFPNDDAGWIQALFDGERLICFSPDLRSARTESTENMAGITDINFLTLAPKWARYGRRVRDGEASQNCIENSGPLRYLPYYNPRVPESVQMEFIQRLSTRFSLILVMKCSRGHYAFFRAAGESRSYGLQAEKLFRGFGSIAPFAPWSLHPFPGGTSKKFGDHDPIFWDPTAITPRSAKIDLPAP